MILFNQTTTTMKYGITFALLVLLPWGSFCQTAEISWAETPVQNPRGHIPRKLIGADDTGYYLAFCKNRLLEFEISHIRKYTFDHKLLFTYTIPKKIEGATFGREVHYLNNRCHLFYVKRKSRSLVFYITYLNNDGTLAPLKELYQTEFRPDVPKHLLFNLSLNYCYMMPKMLRHGMLGITCSSFQFYNTAFEKIMEVPMITAKDHAEQSPGLHLDTMLKFVHLDEHLNLLALYKVTAYKNWDISNVKYFVQCYNHEKKENRHLELEMGNEPASREAYAEVIEDELIVAAFLRTKDHIYKLTAFSLARIDLRSFNVRESIHRFTRQQYDSLDSFKDQTASSDPRFRYICRAGNGLLLVSEDRFYPAVPLMQERLRSLNNNNDNDMFQTTRSAYRNSELLFFRLDENDQLKHLSKWDKTQREYDTETWLECMFAQVDSQLCVLYNENHNNSRPLSNKSASMVKFITVDDEGLAIEKEVKLSVASRKPFAKMTVPDAIMLSPGKYLVRGYKFEPEAAKGIQRCGYLILKD